MILWDFYDLRNFFQMICIFLIFLNIFWCLDSRYFLSPPLEYFEGSLPPLETDCAQILSLVCTWHVIGVLRKISPQFTIFFFFLVFCYIAIIICEGGSLADVFFHCCFPFLILFICEWYFILYLFKENMLFST